ncbi:MAG: hypothetical protein KAG66_10340 [Methylococcales bacterium]|nr:hypothetical protein [Methylococcales bacterium]
MCNRDNNNNVENFSPDDVTPDTTENNPDNTSVSFFPAYRMPVTNEAAVS